MINQNIKKNISKVLVGVTMFTGSFAFTAMTGSVQAEAATAVTNARVNFRTGPSTSDSVMRKLQGVTAIDVISYGSKWAKINESGDIGYISTNYINTTSTGVITGRVNLRTKGNMSGTVITKIPMDETVKVLAGPVLGWYKIVWNTKTGYIYKDYVKVDETVALKTEVAKSNIGMIYINNLPKFVGFKPITAWNIASDQYSTQMLLLTKKIGSIVEVSKAKLTGDDRVVIPGEVIRTWKTTANNQVIRITYNDPETIPFHFITIKEPGGKTTTQAIRTSMRAALDWESFSYD